MLLIFGKTGQLGQSLASLAQSSNIPVTATARDTVDITDRASVESVIKTTRPCLVVNAAAYTAVDLAETEQGIAEQVNTLAPGLVAEACADTKIPMIHISTDYVFDGCKLKPYIESDQLSPVSVYGQTKAAGEARVRDALEQHLILRTSWVYSRYRRNFVKTMLDLSAVRPEISVVADQTGCPTSADDISSAIITAYHSIKQGDAAWGTYHVAGTGITTWYDFAVRVIDFQSAITGRRPHMKAITTRDYPTAAQRPQNSALSSDLFAQRFGYRARPWHLAVKQTVDQLLEGTHDVIT